MDIKYVANFLAEGYLKKNQLVTVICLHLEHQKKCRILLSVSHIYILIPFFLNCKYVWKLRLFFHALSVMRDIDIDFESSSESVHNYKCFIYAEHYSEKANFAPSLRQSSSSEALVVQFCTGGATDWTEGLCQIFLCQILTFVSISLGCSLLLSPVSKAVYVPN